MVRLFPTSVASTVDGSPLPPPHQQNHLRRTTLLPLNDGSRVNGIHPVTLTTAIHRHVTAARAPKATRRIDATPTTWAWHTVGMERGHHPLVTAFLIEQVINRKFHRRPGDITSLMRVYYIAPSLNMSQLF